MANNDDFMKVLAKNVTLQFPKLNQTYRFNTAQQKSEPCAPTASNAAWSIGFEMSKADAKPIFDQLKAHYDACRSRNSKMPQFKTIFGMKKDGSPNKAPTVIDGQKQPLADLAFWGGSKGTVRAWAVAVVDPEGNGGISLLLDAVQVTEARYGDGGMDDFDTVENKSDPFETKPLAEEKRQSIKEELADDIPW